MSLNTITTREVYQAIWDALDGVPELAPTPEQPQSRVFLGEVPGALPEYSNGQVMPYVVIWPRVPTPSDDVPLSGLQLRDGLSFPFQTTCVATDMWGQLMPMMDDVARRLTGLRVGEGEVRQETDGAGFQVGDAMLTDPDLPDRSFGPLRWSLETQ